MTISTVLEEMQSNSPPFQPVVHSRVQRYQERQLHWNPVCVKSDALFYEFSSGEEGGAIQLLPDACINVLFICDPDRPQALLSGAALKPQTLVLKPDTSYFGFKPYSNLGMRPPKMAYTELVDRFTDLLDAFPHAGELGDGGVCMDDRHGWDLLSGRYRRTGFGAVLRIIYGSWSPPQS